MSWRLASIVLFSSVMLAANAPSCATCHRAIWDTYQQTGMGRSFYRPSPESTPTGEYFHAPSNSYFTMLRGANGEFVQRRHQIDAATGKAVNTFEKRIDYVMGSGNHARTYLHRDAATGALTELPLGWYAEKGGYFAMNPGYDRPDHDGFRRPITYDCMFCHNAYPRVPPPAAKAEEHVYTGDLPEGIDCARCHGDGTRHAQLAASGAPSKASIVNPARLSATRQMEGCMACHLESTSFPLPNAIQRFDRGPFSYRAGEPLGDFLLNFDHAPGTGRDDKFEIVSSVYRLRKSKCFLQSKKMQCTTCHDPHIAPRGEAATRHYDQACRQCHAKNHDAKTTGCAECHMPKRRTEDVIHALATDHLIQRRAPADALAERSERRDNYRGPVALHYPPSLPPTPESELYLALAQVKQRSNLTAGIAQLGRAIDRHKPQRAEWYLELGEAHESAGQLAPAIARYRQAVQQDPASAVAAQKLGVALRRSGRVAEAAQELRRATTLAPTRALSWHELGLAYRALGKPNDAIAAMRTALRHDPELPEAHNNLGILLIGDTTIAAAEAAFREAIRIRPDYADAHGNLANLIGPANPTEANAEFETALRLRPNDAPTRFNYAMLLGRTRRFGEAQRELRSALQADPKFADAHELLADLLLAQDQPKEAAEHYRQALAAKPEAVLRLASALVALGDKAGAIAELQKFAASPNVLLRKEVTESLQRLRR